MFVIGCFVLFVFLMLLREAAKLQSSCLRLLSAEVTDMHHSGHGQSVSSLCLPAVSMIQGEGETSAQVWLLEIAAVCRAKHSS